LNPHNAFQLITGSLDGRIKVWDLLDGVLLQTIGVGNPVRHLAAHERWKDFLFVAIARPSKKRKANGTSVVIPLIFFPQRDRSFYFIILHRGRRQLRRSAGIVETVACHSPAATRPNVV
jgi:hypothetical protein